MADFVWEYKIRFEDCDMAGIVFYPRFILMMHRVFEIWCDEGLGTSLRAIHLDLKLGLPIVNLEASFKKASRLEELLQWSLYVKKLGEKSLTMGIEASCDGELRMVFELIVVCASFGNTVISQRIPDQLREKIELFKREE